MVDRVKKEIRSKIMGRIKGKDTKPELKVRSLIHSKGFRYRLHLKDLPGKPDLVFPKYRTVLFVHGCFWHQHPGCKHAHIPQSNVEYWEPKLKKNIARDSMHKKALFDRGWKVITIWECKINEDKLALFCKSLSDNKGGVSCEI